MFRIQRPNRVMRTLALAFVAGLAGFAFGVVLERQGVFPKQLFSSTEYAGSTGDDPILSNLTMLNRSTYGRLEGTRWIGGGGGITRLGSLIIGVDREANAFLYLGSGKTRPLNISLETGKGEFLDFLEREFKGSKRHEKAIQRFRVMDVDAQYVENRVHLYVSHHYWHKDEKAKSLRVSRLVLNEIAELEDGSQADEGQWETIYDSHPLIGASGRSLWSNNSGGRMLLLDERRLLVGVGDHHRNGVNHPSLAGQDPSSSYGKIVSIDLIDLSEEIYAYGIRNPQGLLKDSEGRIWETEHGPRGGDELNLIEEGANYGWPLETYGTSYPARGFPFEWPLNKHNGQHPLYQRPVFAWVPSIGISALIQIQDPKSVWNGDLLVSSLIAGNLYRVKIRESRAILTEPVAINERIRDLLEMENGTILMWTDSGRFIELEMLANELSELDKIVKREGIENLVEMCVECHSFRPSGSNKMKSSLWAVHGRKIGASNFDGYSQALREKKGRWTPRALSSFIRDPQSFARGSTMPNLGISETEAQALVDLLKELR